MKGSSVYAILLFWPSDNTVTLGAVSGSQQTKVTMLGYKGNSFKWKPAAGGKGITVTIPAMTPPMLPCKWAWTLKIDGLSQDNYEDLDGFVPKSLKWTALEEAMDVPSDSKSNDIDRL